MIKTYKKGIYDYNYLTVDGQNLYFAHPLHRFFSSIIDSLIIYIVSIIIISFLLVTDPENTSLLFILQYCSYILYNCILLSFWAGRTLGMYKMKVKLVNKKFKNLNFFLVLIRTLIDVMCLFVGGLPFIVSFLRNDRRTISDMIVGSYVIYEPGKEPNFLLDIK